MVLFVVSARDGLTSEDEEIAAVLRRASSQVLLVANKIDGLDEATALADFASLGMGDLLPVTATHRRGLDGLMRSVDRALPEDAADPAGEDDPDRLRLAIVGRPNVGKSTLVNRLLGEERVLAFDQPGTTRDTLTFFTLGDLVGMPSHPIAFVPASAARYIAPKTRSFFEW